MKIFLNIEEQIDANVQLRGFTELAPIQKGLMEKEITVRDAPVSVQTGSGKTIAFGLSIVSNIPNKNPNDKIFYTTTCIDQLSSKRNEYYVIFYI